VPSVGAFSLNADGSCVGAFDPLSLMLEAVRSRLVVDKTRDTGPTFPHRLRQGRSRRCLAKTGHGRRRRLSSDGMILPSGTRSRRPWSRAAPTSCWSGRVAPATRKPRRPARAPVRRGRRAAPLLRPGPGDGRPTLL